MKCDAASALFDYEKFKDELDKVGMWGKSWHCVPSDDDTVWRKFTVEVGVRTEHTVSPRVLGHRVAGWVRDSLKPAVSITGPIQLRVKMDHEKLEGSYLAGPTTITMEERFWILPNREVVHSDDLSIMAERPGVVERIKGRTIKQAVIDEVGRAPGLHTLDELNKMPESFASQFQRFAKGEED